jgi:hypothetical protein
MCALFTVLLPNLFSRGDIYLDVIYIKIAYSNGIINCIALCPYNKRPSPKPLGQALIRLM